MPASSSLTSKNGYQNISSFPKIKHIMKKDILDDIKLILNRLKKARIKKSNNC